MPTVKTHPLMEIIAKNLTGIHVVPAKTQHAMVRRAAKNAASYFDHVLVYCCNCKLRPMAHYCVDCLHYNEELL